MRSATASSLIQASKSNMSSRANAPQGTDLLGLYVKKLYSVLDMHRVSFGAPEDLPPFLNQLRGDRHLAMDFWALNSAIHTNEGDIPNEQMLDLIVRGVTKKGADEVRDSGDAKLKQTVDDLERLLAGVDIDSPSPDYEDVWPSQTAKRPQAASETRSVEPNLEKRAEAPAQEGRSVEAAAPDPDGEDSVPASEPLPLDADLAEEQTTPLSKHAIGEALSRLEMNSQRLKLHLDSIDNRMSRLEPHIEMLASPPQTHVTRSVTDSAPIANSKPLEPVPDAISHRVPRSQRANPRLVLLTDDGPSSSVPLERYGQGSHGGRLAWFATLLVLAGGTVFAFQRYGDTLRQEELPRLQQVFGVAHEELAKKLHSLIGSVTKDRSPAASTDEQSTDPMSSTTTPSQDALNGSSAPAPAESVETQNAPQNGEAGNNATTPPNDGPTTPPSGPTTPPSVAATPSTDDLTAVASSAVTTGSRGAPKHGRSSHVPADVPDYTAPVGYNPAEMPVGVPAAVMQENLVTSRVPAYPQAAKAEGVEGSVVMQAVISKDGSVSHLHVVQGDPALRSAALDAVSKWHYRPYIVNGRLVPVATTVRVDFKLPRR